MKTLLALALVMGATSAQASQAKLEEICGTYAVESSDGLATVMVDLLNVSAGPTSPAFTSYRLIAASQDFATIMRARDVINSLVEGEYACIEGYTHQDKQFNEVMLPVRRTK